MPGTPFSSLRTCLAAGSCLISLESSPYIGGISTQISESISGVRKAVSTSPLNNSRSDSKNSTNGGCFCYWRKSIIKIQTRLHKLTSQHDSSLGHRVGNRGNVNYFISLL